ncbi:MAG: 16S rRNA (guanine(966)-N(2))-methyltransferase RsmD [Rhodospirillales bacterium]|nr:16S rRNA (guanine(966)-N(2))-methyltransferase RsmD [Rhodospirillales bacterium]
MSGLTILAGRHRGRRLETPPGSSVRPTQARVRKSLFDLLEHSPRVDHRLAGASILDLFAGTGALGIEALSRGAAVVTFVERDPDAVSVLSRNVMALGEERRARILQADALRLPASTFAAEFVFVDAPYGEGLAEPALNAARTVGWVIADGIAAVELGRRETFPIPSGCRLIDERVYGTTRICLLRT